MRQGVPVSPGVAVARALRLDPGPPHPQGAVLSPEAATAEERRFEEARAAAAAELAAVVDRVARQVGAEEADIFRAHLLLLDDPGFSGRVRSLVRERRVDAPAALQQVLDEFSDRFRQTTSDGPLRERLADVRDVASRVQARLARGGVPDAPDGPVVLVAAEILPSQALAFDRPRVAAIVTEKGSTTGHAAILARSLNIPAVAGVRGLMGEVRTGDLVAVDAREGHVYVRPGPEVESAYRKLQREYVDLCGRLADNRDAEPVTRDGYPVELLANVNGVADSVVAGNVGASGVGLYRTEYLFLTHPTVPDEDEQYAAYRAVVEAAPGRSVAVRTLDLGGDKQVPYLGHQGEANPFMGWRSVRLTSAYPEFFLTQLRAILRAGLHGSVSLLFPMISTVEEVVQLKGLLGRARESLWRDRVPFAESVPVGVMVEVPAAALCIERILDEVDFVSIGSNDLVQYLMAADRDNPRVAHLCEPFHPALLRLIDAVVGACNRRGRPVTLCGEMAGWPRCFLPLFGMGLRRLSMSPPLVPSIKEMVRHATLDGAREVARRVLALHTVEEIRSYLTRVTHEVWPESSVLDLRN